MNFFSSWKILDFYNMTSVDIPPSVLNFLLKVTIFPLLNPTHPLISNVKATYWGKVSSLSFMWFCSNSSAISYRPYLHNNFIIFVIYKGLSPALILDISNWESPTAERDFSSVPYGKESACNAGDPGLIIVSERSPGEENGNPLQYSCLKNSMVRGFHGQRIPLDRGLQFIASQRIGHDWASD